MSGFLCGIPQPADGESRPPRFRRKLFKLSANVVNRLTFDADGQDAAAIVKFLLTNPNAVYELFANMLNYQHPKADHCKQNLQYHFALIYQFHT